MKPIDLARQYVQQAVQEPALASTLPAKAMAKVKHSDTWLKQFKRVGDLLVYLERFDQDKQDPLYLEIKSHKLQTFEDIVEPFKVRFERWANDRTRVTDFVIGETYSAHEILIFAGSYDTRSGGMFVLESGGQPEFVVIKATLEGSKYKNEWLAKPDRLKYFLKSRKTGDTETFGEDYKPNAAILNNKKISIVTFVRQTNLEKFTYQGIFKYYDIRREKDGSKWFELMLNTDELQDIPADAQFVRKTLDDQITQSVLGSRAARLARLAIAPKSRPPTMKVVSIEYHRNPDVVAEVLHRANGHCESCLKSAPFIGRAKGLPYLEVHHRAPLASGGFDTVENAMAVCPNCHRQKHFG